MTTDETRELDDRWILPLRGSVVAAVDFGETVTFVLDSGVWIVVGGGAYLSQGSIWGPDADARTLAQLGEDVILRCVGRRVLSAVGFKSGVLRVVFSNGWHLNVGSQPKGLPSEPFVPAAVVQGETALWARVPPAAQG